jgi:hypothetical protein
LCSSGIIFDVERQTCLFDNAQEPAELSELELVQPSGRRLEGAEGEMGGHSQELLRISGEVAQMKSELREIHGMLRELVAAGDGKVEL